MAALVESDLRPSDHGSVGLFQQQVGGAANTREYKGYATRPELQVKWFIESAIAVKMQRYARGIDVRADPRLWGEWIADVERPARQFRGRYQLRLDEARRLLSGAAR